MIRASAATVWLGLFVASTFVATTLSFVPLPTPSSSSCRRLTPLRAITPSGLQTPDGKDLFDMTVEEVVEMHEAAKVRRLLEALTEQEKKAKARQLAEKLAPIQSLTETNNFLAAEVVSFLLSVWLIYGAWVSDWAYDGVISYDTKMIMQEAGTFWAGERLVVTALAGAVAWFKQREVPINTVRTLLVGGLDFFRVALMDDKAVMEERALEALPPLSMEYNTLQMAETQSPTGVLLSISIRTLPGKEHGMRRLLTKLLEDMKPKSNLISTMAVNQDPQDRTTFAVLQRFPDMEAMAAWQADTHYQEFTITARDLLLEPMGLYVTNERKGRLSEPNYPYGPGGEGGRDDAIYSSPTNLDGSQAGIARQAMPASA